MFSSSSAWNRWPETTRVTATTPSNMTPENEQTCKQGGIQSVSQSTSERRSGLQQSFLVMTHGMLMLALPSPVRRKEKRSIPKKAEQSNIPTTHLRYTKYDGEVSGGSLSLSLVRRSNNLDLSATSHSRFYPCPRAPLFINSKQAKKGRQPGRERRDGTKNRDRKRERGRQPNRAR
jgi:hypothetical protein